MVLDVPTNSFRLLSISRQHAAFDVYSRNAKTAIWLARKVAKSAQNPALSAVMRHYRYRMCLDGTRLRFDRVSTPPPGVSLPERIETSIRPTQGIAGAWVHAYLSVAVFVSLPYQLHDETRHLTPRPPSGVEKIKRLADHAFAAAYLDLWAWAEAMDFLALHPSFGVEPAKIFPAYPTCALPKLVLMQAVDRIIQQPCQIDFSHPRTTVAVNLVRPVPSGSRDLPCGDPTPSGDDHREGEPPITADRFQEVPYP